MENLSRQTLDAIKALEQCHALCTSMAMTHCLEQGGEHARPQHLRLMLDCAAICGLTADALGRKSQFHTRLAELCADVCDTCAADCEAMGEMEDCIEACRDCAQQCRQAAHNDQREILEKASQSPPGTAAH